MNEKAFLLGIDSGLTVTKAVIFDAEGHEIAVGERRVEQHTPHPRWVERDMLVVWDACQQVIREALTKAKLTGDQITGIGITGHGDGVYLIDEAGNPARPGILSLDTRAYDVVQEWRDSGVLEQALPLTGQYPYAAAPAALMAWIKRNEPEVYACTRWVLSCKDWIRYQLTGKIATDPTEASVSFTDVNTQRYTPQAFRLFDVTEVEAKMPPVVAATGIIGHVTEAVAQATGLKTGTPVVSGLHDVDASAIGTGCSRPGQLSMTAGTFSINQVISDEPVIDARWACRNFVDFGQWMNMSISPASATNLDWFVRELYQSKTDEAAGKSVYDQINREVKLVLDEPTTVYFLPFIFGSPHGDQASAGFFGLRGWHKTAHMLRAVFEGVAFNHKTHIDALRSAFQVNEVRVTGGATRSTLWCQIFADTFNLPVVTTETGQTGALGTAICAGLGTDVYSSLDEAIDRTVRIVRVYEPKATSSQQLTDAYHIYMKIVKALMPVWSHMDA